MTSFFQRAVSLTMGETTLQMLEKTNERVVYHSEWNGKQMTFTVQTELIDHLSQTHPVYTTTAYLLEDWNDSILEIYIKKGEETLILQIELTYIQQRHNLTYSYYEARFDLDSIEDVYIHRMNEFTQKEVEAIRDQVITYIRDMNAYRLLFLTNEISVTEG